MTRRAQRWSSPSWDAREVTHSSLKVESCMDTKVIPLSDFQAAPEGVLSQCIDTGQTVFVALPNCGVVSIQPVESGDDLVDDLIEHNAAFRELLTKSLASPREPFPFSGSEE